MINKWLYYSGIVITLIIVSLSFKPFNHGKPKAFSKENTNTKSVSSTDTVETTDYDFKIPFTGKSFTGFKEAIGFKESQGRYKLINSLGYMGKYQFGIDALKAIGINNTVAFLNNPKLQEIAFRVLLSKNKSDLQEEIAEYEGKVIDGIKITESGILAAAHLGGVGSVRKYLRSNGKSSNKDSYGTTLHSYIKKFGGYDTSSIEMDSHAKVCMK